MALQVKIHQVVILNICDHFTRNALQKPKESRRIAGALFGTQMGRTLNVLGSFEASFKANLTTNEIDSIDYEYINTKMQLLKEANFYKDCEFLGWYSSVTNMQPLSKDLEIHKGFYPLNENPIYITFDPAKQISGYDLPLKVFETKISAEKDKSESLAEVSHEVEAVKAEIISVEHLSKNMASSHTSLFADNMSNSVNSLQILREKIQLLLEFLHKNPKVQNDPEFMRELKEVCINIPDKFKTDYREDIIQDYKETSLINMLSSLLVANKTIQDVIHLRPQFDIKTVKAYED